MDNITSTDGRTTRRTYLKRAGAGALTVGVAGCLGFGGNSPEGQTGDSDGGTSGNDEGAVSASFDCSKFLETHPYSRDKPTFSFQFVVPKNWEGSLPLNDDSGSSIRMVAPVTKGNAAIAHSLTITENRKPMERKRFVDFYTKFGYEKLDPRPYGSGEIIVLHSESGVITETNVKRALYTWLLGLPTSTDEKVHNAKIKGFASTRAGEVPLCKEAVKKTTEKTVNSIRPK